MNACRSVCEPTGLVIPARRAYLADDPGSAMTVQPAAVRGQEDWPLAPLADRQVDRPGGAWRERHGDDLAALAGDHQGPVPALDAQCLNVGAPQQMTRTLTVRRIRRSHHVTTRDSPRRIH
jgi:hypothetical protein